MKQHVTPEQVFGLSIDAYNRYLDYFRKMKSFVGTLTYFEPLKDGKMLPCMSIGQMIEFLELHLQISIGELSFPKRRGKICDALWEGVKEVLEENE